MKPRPPRLHRATLTPMAIATALLCLPFLAGLSATTYAAAVKSTEIKPTDVQQSLSLQEAEQLAIRHDQGLDAAQTVRDANASAARAANQLPDPTVSVQLANLPLDTFSFTQSPMTMTQVSLSQMLPPGDTLAQRALVADAKTAAATANLAVKTQILRREVGRFWLTVYRDRQTLALRQQERTLYRKLLHSAETAYSVGRARPTDLVRLRVRLAELDDRIEQLRGDTAATQARLARWIGPRAEAPWPSALPEALTTLPQGDLNNQPELNALRAQLAEARAETGVARAAFKPQFGVQLGYGIRAGHQPDTLSVGVSMSLPIFTGERQTPLLVAAQKRAQARQLDLDNRAAELHAQAEALRQALASLDRRIHGYDHDILPQLRQVAKIAQNQFGSGSGEFTAVIDAEQAILQGRQQRLDLMIDRAGRLIDLRYLLENPA
ncbi:TolC family protein [Halothiobacillus diazotrophicus]|uniref:TolC family protein n=1 Tax=Halothiobacillus diazotrophicus TaxID=1860122 RepID=UPI0009EF6719|nr:TolC family protein [Halothiobacillus diazotrophicus]